MHGTVCLLQLQFLPRKYCRCTEKKESHRNDRMSWYQCCHTANDFTSLVTDQWNVVLSKQTRKGWRFRNDSLSQIKNELDWTSFQRLYATGTSTSNSSTVRKRRPIAYFSISVTSFVYRTSAQCTHVDYWSLSSHLQTELVELHAVWSVSRRGTCCGNSLSVLSVQYATLRHRAVSHNWYHEFVWAWSHCTRYVIVKHTPNLCCFIDWCQLTDCMCLTARVGLISEVWDHQASVVNAVCRPWSSLVCTQSVKCGTSFA